MKRVVVLIEFADRDCFSKRYGVGEELFGFDEERIADLVNRGIVKVEDDEQEDTQKTSAADLIAYANESENLEALNELLNSEREREKPRSTVVKAIEERIAKLSEEQEDKQSE